MRRLAVICFDMEMESARDRYRVTSSASSCACAVEVRALRSASAADCDARVEETDAPWSAVGAECVGVPFPFLSRFGVKGLGFRV